MKFSIPVYYFSACFLLLLLSNCNQIPAGKLYGKWKYIQVENLNINDTDSVTAGELKIQDPLIEFTKSNKLVIYWGGKILSHGTFKMENRMIRFTEDLGNGKTREFPFLIKDISESVLVFETMSASSTRVRAVKVSD